MAFILKKQIANIIFILGFIYSIVFINSTKNKYSLKTENKNKYKDKISKNNNLNTNNIQLKMQLQVKDFEFAKAVDLIKQLSYKLIEDTSGSKCNVLPCCINNLDDEKFSDQVIEYMSSLNNNFNKVGFEYNEFKELINNVKYFKCNCNSDLITCSDVISYKDDFNKNDLENLIKPYLKVKAKTKDSTKKPLISNLLNKNRNSRDTNSLISRVNIISPFLIGA